jgi:transposase
MPAPLTPWQLELARHYFQYNNSSTYYLNKLSTQDIADDIQCTIRTVQKLRKLWDKTGDVEKLRKRPGRERSLDEYVK